MDRKNQGRLHRSSPRPSKRLTLRSRSDFCEVKRQAPLCEGQALSRPLRALPRPSAMPPHPTRSSVGVPSLRDCRETLPPLYFARPKSLIAEGRPRSHAPWGTTRLVRSRVYARDEASGSMPTMRPAGLRQQ